MNFKDFFHKTWQSMKEIWHKKIIQRSTRISYHILWNIILFFLTVGIVGGFFVAGLGAGYFASLVNDEEIQTEEQMASAIYNYEETSELYFADNVFLSEVSTDLLREEVSLDKVSEHVRNAVIATEDQYFNTHKGIVPKAIMRAIFQEVTNSATQSGGSTLTQQVIKNQILTNEVSFERKAKEMLLAMRLEQFFKKDEILEVYLNIVSFGRNSSGQNIAGVETAAEGIFGVSAEELNLAQSAFIAGLPQSPSYYTPFVNGGGVKDQAGLEPGLNRMKTVLSRMLEAQYITEAQYQEALNYDIVADFKPAEESILEQYPYLMEELKDRSIDILVEVLAEQDGYTAEDLASSDILKEEYRIRANREIGSNGYKIHSTIDKEIYDVFQKIAKEYNNYGRDKLARNENDKNKKPIMIEDPETGEMVQLGDQPVQVGSVLVENKTGKILSFVGGRDFEISQKNHATEVRRQNGSTMKPLAGYGPAMEMGEVQPGSVIADVEKTYAEGYSPGNFSLRFYGLTPVREALYRSHNATAVSVFTKINGPHIVTDYLSKMGFSAITEQEGAYDSLVLGSPTNGITIEENTNAYVTFGNMGNFVDGYMIEKIETKDGEVIYQHESKEVEVFSPQTSYLMIDMLRDVLSRGTGTAAKSNLSNQSVDWAGKTGTTNDFRDTWFVATNPNVTLGSWMGYDYNQQLDKGYNNRNNIFWAKLVNAATEIRPELMAPTKRFESPGGIVSRSFCATSGLLPSDLCSEVGLVQSDIYNANFVPTKQDYSLIKESYATIRGEVVLAGENTPEEFTDGNGVSFNPEWLRDMGYTKLANIKQLTAGKSGTWQNIKYPSEEEVSDDGKAPSAPTSLQINNQRLNWNHSSSNDVVGYRIYRASNPDDKNFQRIGSTSDTSFTVPSSKAVYLVRAVDYFGQESAESKSVIKGDFSEPVPKPEPKPEKQEQKKDKQKTEKEQKPKPKPEESDSDENTDSEDEENDNTTSNEDNESSTNNKEKNKKTE
ncbi:multimodular transpeptidase-transglycosylase [Gracilibacillus boraciitolerans JCM 21714]|uniref:Multimodular transpeptidase-transglycosylase n=1 Tax=Gracilibacillus boraciitolerans JCM 21714 TaxID=1298598 RepID=W4VHS3_9BACI|nr:transglycosylase domain-containing protein [Gracilibacillus boraciitolerans]GAE92925.1 multimodular transpeptidase-transglycosylase [Gracilibacillus boraciitolerans JCM 21714]